MSSFLEYKFHIANFGAIYYQTLKKGNAFEWGYQVN